MKSTRAHLDRVPDDKFGWQPHDKSMTLGRLSSHLADLPSWLTMTIKVDQFDMHPPGGEPMKPAHFNTREETLAAFDKNVAAAREALAGATDEEFMKNWSLLNGGQTLMSMPKIACVRTWCMNHIIHHRAQLGVYLRLNDVPVPSVYGPSADEGSM